MNTSNIRVRMLLRAMVYFEDDYRSWEVNEAARALSQVKLALDGEYQIEPDFATISSILDKREIAYESTVDGYGCGSINVEAGYLGFVSQLTFYFGALDSIEAYE